MAVTPDTAVNPIEEPGIQPPSTAGMTTKVVKGSMWTLGGSVLPLAVAFVTTPFVIRLLGAESYGVLLLVGLVPMYFSFADFGMGIASTRFASEAYGQGDSKKESEVVWTAVAVAGMCSLLIAIPIFLFSRSIVIALNIPEHLIGDANIALKITSAAFVLTLLGSVLNSPMLARLRMDLNTITQAIPKILLAAITPVILYFGGGIVGAVAWGLVVAAGTIAAIVFYNGRLFPGLFKGRINLSLLRPLLKFGAGWVIGMMAVVLMVNLDKLFLAKMVSVTSLAHYSVAFTFANTATIFSSAMVQSMIPAFSQLNTPEKKGEFDALFARAVRLNLIWIFPAVTLMFVIARPFFTIWAGPEFGVESTLPFYIFLAGIAFGIAAYVPYTAIIAAGHTHVLAKLYWAELLLYVVGLILLIGYFGIAGAAAAWSLRVICDAIAEMLLARRLGIITFGFTRTLPALFGGVAVLCVPMALSLFYDDHPWVWLSVLPVSLAIYCLIIWNLFVQRDEQIWLRSRLKHFLSYSS